jgi:hypothetical protein
MRQLIGAVGCFALLTAACGNQGNPIGPVRVPSPSPAPTPPPFADTYTQISVGDVVSGRATADDPVCDAWHCQYFRLTASRDGVLEVVMTPTGNLDASVTDSQGRTWWDPKPGLQVRVSTPVKAGATYEIAIWEYTSGQFELRTSLQ